MGWPGRIIFQSTYMISNASKMGALMIRIHKKMKSSCNCGTFGPASGSIGDNPRDLVWVRLDAVLIGAASDEGNANISLSSRLSGRLYLCLPSDRVREERIVSIFPGHNFLCVAPVRCRIWKCHLMQNPEIGNFRIPTCWPTGPLNSAVNLAPGGSRN